jgi:hypothetical protein
VILCIKKTSSEAPERVKMDNELFKLREENRRLKIFNKVYRDQLIKLSWDFKILQLSVKQKISKLNGKNVQ